MRVCLVTHIYCDDALGLGFGGLGGFEAKSVTASAAGIV